jgi:hypothetical protein
MLGQMRRGGWGAAVVVGLKGLAWISVILSGLVSAASMGDGRGARADDRTRTLGPWSSAPNSFSP